MSVNRSLTRARIGRAAGGLVALVLAFAGCASAEDFNYGRSAYDRDQLAEALADERAQYIIGEFPLADHAVVDGDTVKVDGLDASLRLLGIDTEETFKSEKDLRAYEAGFEEYLDKKRGTSERPIKAATPMGMEAKAWAQDFFRGVTTVRLERDHPRQLRGAYGRFLAYVFVDKGGEWVNYNVEAVRAGMSPYFTKYGYSRRFHDEFVQAQEEARAAEIGIWDPNKEHYPDYEERLTWWDARAKVIAEFERDADGDPTYVSLSDWDAMDRLSQMEGNEVVLLGAVSKIRPREGRIPARVALSRRMFEDFPLVFFDDDVLADSKVEDAKGEFIRVRGTVSRYHFKKRRGRRRGNSQLQIEIKNPAQIMFIDTRPGDAAARTSASMVPPEAPPPPPEAPPPPPLSDDASSDDLVRTDDDVGDAPTSDDSRPLPPAPAPPSTGD